MIWPICKQCGRASDSGISFESQPTRLSKARQPSQIPPANPATLQLVPVRAGPVGFQTQVTSVSIIQQRGDLAFPVDVARPEWTPLGRVAVQAAVLGVHVDNAVRWNELIAVREWVLAGVLAAGTGWAKNDGLVVLMPALFIGACLLAQNRRQVL